MTATPVYLVRHCDVENPGRILYGHLEGFRLSEKGVRQAHALGERLASTSARQIYTSPLERAQQTARIIASHLDNVPVTVTPELTEARFGRYLQGVRANANIIWRRPLWAVHMVWPGILPNDESVAEMARRVRAPLLRLVRDHPAQGGICVSHGDPIQALWVEADRRGPWALHRLQCAKGGMLELDYDGERLLGKRYLPPEETGASADGSTAADASHA
ncbi:MAG TPA: histidine phosphatase family protein [Candidatus Dormibacteraeota bacterium]